MSYEERLEEVDKQKDKMSDVDYHNAVFDILWEYLEEYGPLIYEPGELYLKMMYGPESMVEIISTGSREEGDEGIEVRNDEGAIYDGYWIKPQQVTHLAYRVILDIYLED